MAYLHDDEPIHPIGYATRHDIQNAQHAPSSVSARAAMFMIAAFIFAPSVLAVIFVLWLLLVR